MAGGYNSRFERRDLVLATITGVIGGCTVVVAIAGVILLVSHH